jgi:hypothetical protein
MKTVEDKLHEILNNVILKASRKDIAVTKIRKIIESQVFAKTHIIERAFEVFNRKHIFDLAVKLLKDLYDLQNGPPLPTYTDDYNKTMDEIDKFLTKVENENIRD